MEPVKGYWLIKSMFKMGVPYPCASAYLDAPWHQKRLVRDGAAKGKKGEKGEKGDKKGEKKGDQRGGKGKKGEKGEKGGKKGEKGG